MFKFLNKIESSNQDYIFTCLITLLLSVVFFRYAYSSIIAILLIVASVIYAIYTKRLYLTTALLIPVLLYLYFIASLMWSVDFNETLKFIERKLLFLVLPLIFICIPRITKKGIKKIFNAHIVLSCLYAMYFLIRAFLRYRITLNPDEFFYHNLVVDDDLHAVYVSVYFAISIIYILNCKRKKTGHYVALFILSLLIVLLSSKNIIIVLFLCGIISLLRIKISNKTKYIFLLFVFASVVLVIISFKTIKKRFSSELRWTSFQEVFTKDTFGKTYLWTGTSLRLFQARLFKEQLEEENIFWKGFGAGASKDNITQGYKKYDLYKGFWDYNYHNQYIQIFSELGIIGLFAVLTMLGISFYKSINNKDVFMFQFTFIIAFIFLTESFIWRHRGLLIFFIFYGLLHQESRVLRKELK